MSALADLNPEQRAAAAHPPSAGPLLVVAGAGTGKTQMLAARLAWLLQQGADPQRLMLLSFSRRAAGELARRAARALREHTGLGERRPAPQLPWCGTFHAVAARLLRELAPALGLAEGFTVLDRGDSEDLMAHTRQQLGLAEREQRVPLAGTCMAIHSRCINTGQPLDEVLAAQWPWCHAQRAALARLFAAYGEAKLQQQLLDFDDLLLAWCHVMRQPALAERVRARFDHVLVDEVQDINTLQAELLLALAPRTAAGSFTAVGDDAQAIYGFRGASVRHILELPQRLSQPGRPQAVLRLLTQNYRSTPQILAVSNALMEGAHERHAKQLWSERPGGARPRLLTVEDEAAQAHGVADAVLAAREGGLVLKRQAVLFRTGTHSAVLELELVRRGIPFVKYGGLRFMDTAHVKDVLAVLRWADNPAGRLAALRCARLVPGLGPASQQRLLALLAEGRPLERFTPPPAARASWQALCTLMQQLRGPAARWPDDFAAVLAWYQPHLERLHADARVRRVDLEQLQAVAATHGDRRRFVTELALEPPEASGDESGPPLRDEDYLILSTLHSAKGQEWSAVHILNVVDGCLPADLATGSAAEIEEERRLLYVGMTRARETLTLWAPQRMHVTQQREWGGRHLYVPRSRFLDAPVMAQLEAGAWPAHERPEPSGPVGVTAEPAAFDLAAALRQGWRRP